MITSNINLLNNIYACPKQNKKQVVFVVSTKKVLKKVKNNILNIPYLKLELS